MTPSIPQREPKSAVAGDQWRWQKYFGDYPPSEGWLLQYLLRGPSSLEVAAVALPDGSGYDITVTSADTGTLTSGAYEWAAVLTHSTEGRQTVERGLLIVEPDFSQLIDGDLVSHEDRMVEILTDVIEGRAGDDVQFQIIGGRQIQFIPIKELVQLRDYYLAKQRARRSGGHLPRHVVTFRG